MQARGTYTNYSMNQGSQGFDGLALSSPHHRMQQASYSWDSEHHPSWLWCIWIGFCHQVRLNQSMSCLPPLSHIGTNDILCCFSVSPSTP